MCGPNRKLKPKLPSNRIDSARHAPRQSNQQPKRPRRRMLRGAGCFDGGSSRLGYYSQPVQYRESGVIVARPVIDKRTVVGPASYAADGIPIDLSAVFTSLKAVRILRAYVTATGAVDDRIYEVNEVGTDTFANRKFRIKVHRAPTPAGSNSAPTFTGVALGGHVHVFAGDALATHVHTLFSGGNCGTVACAGTITHANASVGSGATGGGTPSGSISSVGAGTPAGTVSAPVFTGAAPTAGLSEIAGSTPLSTITIEYEAIGII